VWRLFRDLGAKETVPEHISGRVVSVIGSGMMEAVMLGCGKCPNSCPQSTLSAAVDGELVDGAVDGIGEEDPCAELAMEEIEGEEPEDRSGAPSNPLQGMNIDVFDRHRGVGAVVDSMNVFVCEPVQMQKAMIEIEDKVVCERDPQQLQGGDMPEGRLPVKDLPEMMQGEEGYRGQDDEVADDEGEA
jgi:hypothetical protein